MPAAVERFHGEGESLWSRRELLSYAGWAAMAACFGAGALAFVRLMYPRVLFEPPTAWKAGYPSEYSVNSVSSRWMNTHRCWIVRWPDGLFAILAICTHLGCTPLWLAGENKYKCPCHGSGYRMDGTNFEGPAPRPMEHIYIALADDGQILCDRSIVFRKERGEWGKPGCFLKFRA
jgi:cytochrome b6-f complex iron-sulfur subunit